MAIVDNLEIQIQANADQAAASINNLATAMRNFQKASGTSSAGMQSANNAIKNVANQANAAASGVSGAPRIGFYGEALDAAGEVEQLNSALSETQTNGEAAAEGLSETGNSAGETAKKASTAAKEVKKLGDETKKAGKSASGAAKGGLSNFVSSLKRIAFYRFIRSIIKGITDGLKEGISNLYQWSKAQKDVNAAAFSQSMDKLSTSMQYLKNSVAAAVSPLINALAPVIDLLVDKIISFINVINQLFSALSGKSTWTKAIKAPKEYAAASAGAAKAQQKWLAGFDELNNITTNEGGGGGSSANYGDMFEQAEYDEGVLNFLDKIKTKWEEMGLTEKFGKLQEAWDNLKNSGFFEWLGDTLINLGVNIADVGFDTITDALNLIADLFSGDWIHAFEDFCNLIDDINFGPLQIIASLIDSIFGTNIAGWIKGVRDELRKTRSERIEIGNKFMTDPAYRNAVLDQMIKDVGKAFPKMGERMQLGKNFITDEKFRGEVLGKLEQDLKNAWAVIQAVWAIVSGWFDNNVIKPIKNFFSGLYLYIKQRFELAWKTVKEIWNNPGKWFQDNVIQPIKNKFEEVKKNAKEKFDGAWSNVKSAFSSVGTWFYNNLYVPINDKFIKIKSEIGIKMREAWESVKQAFRDVGSFFTGVWNTISGIFKSIGTTIGNAVGSAFRSVVNSVLGWVEGTVNTVISKINTVLDFAKRFGYRGGTIKPVMLPRVYDNSRATRYASGGFPEMGELFMAREAGPELVGRIGNKTAVANNEQIIEGVANGVYNAIVNTGLVGMVGSIDRKSGNGGAIFAPSVAAGRWVSRSLAMYQTAGGTV